MSTAGLSEEIAGLAYSGGDPEYWVDQMPKHDLIENGAVRFYCGATFRSVVLLRYTAIVPRSALRPFAALLIGIADLMDRLDRDRADAMN